MLKNTTIAQKAAFMKEIIVIYGDSNVGKTTVINEIYDDLVKNGASIKNAKSQQGGNPKDFDAELNYNGKNIALMSMGDIVGRVTDIVLKYKLSDVLITAYNTRHATLSQMTRPPISYFSISIHTFIFLYSVISLNFLIFCLSHFWAVISSKNCSFLASDNPVASCIVVTMTSFFITLSIFSKRILIGLVHVYQRYAPESRRRMCLFKPTCSEYAILALNKYGSIRGTIKTIDRLKRCKGDKYHIDYP